MLSELERLLLRAISDPGSVLPRGDDYNEPIPHWEMRAVLVALDDAGLMITDKVRIDDLTDQVAGRDATIQRVRDLAEQMRGWTSPYGMSVDYAARIDKAIDGDPADDGSAR